MRGMRKDQHQCRLPEHEEPQAPGQSYADLLLIWGFPEIRGTTLGVPIMRTIVFLGLYWGPLNLGNYHINQLASPFDLIIKAQGLRSIGSCRLCRILRNRDLGLESGWFLAIVTGSLCYYGLVILTRGAGGCTRRHGEWRASCRSDGISTWVFVFESMESRVACSRLV